MRFIIEKTPIQKLAAAAGSLKTGKFTGKTAGELAAWFEARKIQGLEIDGKQLGLKVETRMNGKKTVYICATGGEDIQNVEYVEEVDESASVDGSTDIQVEDEMPKSYDPAGDARANRQKAAANSDKAAKATGVDIGAASKAFSGFAYSANTTRRIAEAKAYNRAVSRGEPIALPGGLGSHVPVFEDADQAALFSACVIAEAGKSGKARSAIADRHREAGDVIKSITGKTMNTFENDQGGSFVFPTFDATLISLKNTYGAIRRAVGVTPMQSDTHEQVKEGAEVTAAFYGEGAEITAQDAGTSIITATAKKSGVLVDVSNDLLRSSAVPMGDYLARKFARAQAKFEDNVCINGTGSVRGLADRVGANSTYDAALSAGWENHTIAGIQEWIALPGSAAEQSTPAILCNRRFYVQVLRTFGLSAGGNEGASVLGGIAPYRVMEWDGIPIYITDIMPGVYAADQISAYFGAFGAGCFFGEVEGASELAVSEHVKFNYDITSFRFLSRWAWNPHGVNDNAITSDDPSVIAALKD